MPHRIKYIIACLCLLLVHQTVWAGIPVSDLKFELTAVSPVYEQGAVIEFRLRITNQSNSEIQPVWLPAPGYKGPKFIYLTAHNVDQRDVYTEVAREEGIGAADTATAMYTRYLKPGEFIDVSLKLYERPRFTVLPSEGHWFNRPLAPGVYQFLAWYQPFGSPATYKIMYDEARGKAGFAGQGNYCTVEIKPRDASKNSYSKLEQCGENCSFCRDIEKGRWGKVERIMAAQLKGNYKETAMREVSIASHGYWLDQHRNVVYISPWPEAILSIFPGRIGRTVGFKSKDNIYYYNMTIQLGKIYFARSRIQSLMYYVSHRFRLFKTTNENYIGLHNFRRASSVSFYYGVNLH